jgi:phage terminase Nu1 subunit (DNA packaging protein)
MKMVLPNPNEAGRPVPAAHLAALLGVSETTIQELARKRIIPRTTAGTYPVQAAIRDYCAHLRAAATGRPAIGASKALARERLRLMKEQADKAELQNRVTRRELVPLSEVEADWVRQLVALRARMLALPSRVQQRLPNLTASEARQIDAEVRETLTELVGDCPPADQPRQARKKASRGG